MTTASQKVLNSLLPSWLKKEGDEIVEASEAQEGSDDTQEKVEEAETAAETPAQQPVADAEVMATPTQFTPTPIDEPVAEPAEPVDLPAEPVATEPPVDSLPEAEPVLPPVKETEEVKIEAPVAEAGPVDDFAAALSQAISEAPDDSFRDKLTAILHKHAPPPEEPEPEPEDEAPPTESGEVGAEETLNKESE